MQTDTLDITREDIDYIRHGESAQMLRLFKPSGAGPFPTVVDLHGGAWCKGDLTGCQDRDEMLASAGFAVAALNFRHAGDGYPSSLIDINYAVRWLKGNSNALGLAPTRFAFSGQSSGGHLAMLAAMRPRDPRYAGLALESPSHLVDATVRCVAMLWPVINPLSRYRHANRLRESANPPAWVGDIPERHDLYWVTEANMAEGNPMLALENGETVETPPAIWIQGRPDDVHDYHDPESGGDVNEPERFADNYRKAGGDIELVYIDQAARDTHLSVDPLIPFFRRNLA